MEGPSGPNNSKCGNVAMERLTVSESGRCLSDSCQCDRIQSEVKVKSKRYGRGAVESGRIRIYFSKSCSQSCFLNLL